MATNSCVVILSFLLLAFIYLVVFPNDFKLQAEFSSSPSCSNGATASASGQPVDLRVFLGVLTLPGMYERRAHLRLAYSLQARPVRAVIDVRFVFCNLDKEEDRVLVAMEIIAHGDIVVLNCTENLDDGKTYEYFSTIPRMFADEPYDYELRYDRGYEDMVFGRWVRKAGKFKNVYGEEPRMYDYWDRETGVGEGITCFRHEIIADTVAVHKVKNNLKWARLLNFFNATRAQALQNV
ncbi:hypothetical protein EJB05_20411, partial [Eragrostis curvula]